MDFASWLKRLRSGGLVPPSRNVVHFEVHDVVVDKPEEESVKVEADAAEHSLVCDRPEAGELIENVIDVLLADRHGDLSRSRLRIADCGLRIIALRIVDIE